ncbi:MAG: hypothetical protein D6800_04200, partial [Candidatus Zixiibacteriota bacterium]
MTSKETARFEVLRQLAVMATRGEEIRPAAERALAQTVKLAGLSAASLYLWDKEWVVNLAVTHSESENAGQRLGQLEEDLFRALRRERQLVSAYLSFGGEAPYQTFTLPLQYRDTVFGALIGIQEGGEKLLNEDTFLEALSATIALQIAAAGAGTAGAAMQDVVDRERLAAILETAVTVNHEINNPLTAILGNVQLLLMHRKDLDEDLAGKLKTIEASALRIRDITQRLLNLT